MALLDEIKAKAAALKKTIVLCEGEDRRVVEAAAQITKEGIAKIVLIGNEEEAKKVAPGVDLTGITLVDPLTSEKTAEYAKILYEARKAKGMTEEQAAQQAKDRTMFGALMLKAGDVDGYVSGACHSTANTLRPGLQVIKTAPGIKTVSSCFIMIAPEGGNKYNPDGVAVFADCAINIEPDAQQLADIAVSTAKTAKVIAGIEPRVAMLSFSTKGSGNDDKFFKSVPKVQEATALAKQMAPDLALDGEFQFDAAVAPEVGQLKAPGSAVAGHANVFIFPNINAGNIGYKIAQRFGGYMAIGPVCQGFAKPLNDLSRGCNVDDIVATVAVTALQAE
ncbi:MAG TPA: phosphate acetyltransferase [Candidatus Coproplasma excrementigallinarum]|uniref:Phosphate acetyltransferase n=1 Tax=Candidatus Coproplasma excrementigallinarum TaxID=2840747 RepID=A0A9D1ML09_9FIRM|nr:phosphate acetyltransferase [Candidatus Coproplasma excrementigallinarum]